MKDVFDEDSESDGDPIPAAKRSADRTGAAVRREREENKAALLAMMDEETPSTPIPAKDDVDEHMKDAPEDPGSPDWPSDVDDETADAALDRPIPKEPSSQDARPSGDGRSRSRRRVLKKKTFQDEKGYFVTREVEEWEEFSESEEEKKPAPKVAPKVTSLDTKKKGTTAPTVKSKGSITAFFGRKQ
jgi:DNA polymerase delta subunit 3